VTYEFDSLALGSHLLRHKCRESFCARERALWSAATWRRSSRGSQPKLFIILDLTCREMPVFGETSF
jgi:hypothetical protein